MLLYLSCFPAAPLDRWWSATALCVICQPFGDVFGSLQHPTLLRGCSWPRPFFSWYIFQAQNWNSFTSACSVEAKDEVTEIWHPSGLSVWFPPHLLSRLLGLVWEPYLTGSSSAMSMTYRSHLFHKLWVENSEQKQTDTWRESQIFGRGGGEDFCKFFLLGKR